jgi:deoxycytidine triphosphate deaminase
MILTDKQILEAVANGDIIIEPWRPENLGTNSYDVHLGKHIAFIILYHSSKENQVWVGLELIYMQLRAKEM